MILRLLVSLAIVMAAAPRAHLLADGADADLGFLQLYVGQNAAFFARGAHSVDVAPRTT
jgi:hypothetical protein